MAYKDIAMETMLELKGQVETSRRAVDKIIEKHVSYIMGQLPSLADDDEERETFWAMVDDPHVEQRFHLHFRRVITQSALVKHREHWDDVLEQAIKEHLGSKSPASAEQIDHMLILMRAGKLLGKKDYIWFYAFFDEAAWRDRFKRAKNPSPAKKKDRAAKIAKMLRQPRLDHEAVEAEQADWLRRFGSSSSPGWPSSRRVPTGELMRAMQEEGLYNADVGAVLDFVDMHRVEGVANPIPSAVQDVAYILQTAHPDDLWQRPSTQSAVTTGYVQTLLNEARSHSMNAIPSSIRASTIASHMRSNGLANDHVMFYLDALNYAYEDELQGQAALAHAAESARYYAQENREENPAEAVATDFDAQNAAMMMAQLVISDPSWCDPEDMWGIGFENPDRAALVCKPPRLPNPLVSGSIHQPTVVRFLNSHARRVANASEKEMVDSKRELSRIDKWIQEFEASQGVERTIDEVKLTKAQLKVLLKLQAEESPSITTANRKKLKELKLLSDKGKITQRGRDQLEVRGILVYKGDIGQRKVRYKSFSGLSGGDRISGVGRAACRLLLQGIHLSSNMKTQICINNLIEATCSGRSALCEAYCYGHGIRLTANNAMYAQNTRAFARFGEKDVDATAMMERGEFALGYKVAEKAIEQVADDIVFIVNSYGSDNMRWNGIGDLTDGQVRVINAIGRRHPEFAVWGFSRKPEQMEKLDVLDNIVFNGSVDESTKPKALKRIIKATKRLGTGLAVVSDKGLTYKKSINSWGPEGITRTLVKQKTANIDEWLMDKIETEDVHVCFGEHGNKGVTRLGVMPTPPSNLGPSSALGVAPVNGIVPECPATDPLGGGHSINACQQCRWCMVKHSQAKKKLGSDTLMEHRAKTSVYTYGVPKDLEVGAQRLINLDDATYRR